MPGAKIHDATGCPKFMGNLAYRKGLNAPDYLKRIPSKEKFEKYCEGCNPEDMLTWEELEVLKSYEFHFGKSSNPGIETFLSLEFVDLNKPFWKGYYTHLIGDKMVYDPKNSCVNPEKFMQEGRPKDKLHRDWDITNEIIDKEFGIEILPEIEELGLVKYITGENPRYVNVDNIIKIIYEIREMKV